MNVLLHSVFIQLNAITVYTLYETNTILFSVKGRFAPSVKMIWIYYILDECIALLLIFINLLLFGTSENVCLLCVCFMQRVLFCWFYVVPAQLIVANPHLHWIILSFNLYFNGSLLIKDNQQVGCLLICVQHFLTVFLIVFCFRKMCFSA